MGHQDSSVDADTDLVADDRRIRGAKRISVAIVAALTAMLFVFSSAPASSADPTDPGTDPAATAPADPVDPPDTPPADQPQAPATASVVAFNANGGTVATAQKAVKFGAKYGTLPTPKRTGYTFTGWYTAKSGGKKVTSTSVAPKSGDITLFARWSVNTYTVKFAPQSGRVSRTSQKVKYGAAYGTLPTPTRTGYNFTGWYTASSGGDKVTASSKMTKAGTQTLYARWSGKTYTVKFAPQSGTVSPTSATVKFGSAYGTLPTATRTGYSLQGWYTRATGGTRVTATTKVTTTGTRTLYARWTAKKYTVSFDANGGSVKTASKSVTYNATYGSLPTPTRSGYSFSGWYTQDSGGSRIVATTKVKITAAQTVYARWSKMTDHWVDIDLTTQTLKMMDGDTVVATYPISSGKPSTPTPTGTYKVYAQTADQSMGGYKHVKWCTWWYPNIAIHTAYWHNEFGKKAVSHGCINMREADAKVIYNWLRVGSTVYVHGKWVG